MCHPEGRGESRGGGWAGWRWEKGAGAEAAEGGHSEGTRLAGPRGIPRTGAGATAPCMVRIKRPGKRRWGEGRGRGGTCCLIPPNSALTPSRSASIEVDMINRPSTTMQQLLQTDVSQNNNKYRRLTVVVRRYINNNTPQQPRGQLFTISPPSNNNTCNNCCYTLFHIRITTRAHTGRNGPQTERPLGWRSSRARGARLAAAYGRP